MPTKPAIKGFTAWSYSRLSAWEECPLRAKLKNLDKRDEGPKGPALIRGNEIHSLAEKFASGQTKTLPKELGLFKAEFATLKKMKPLVEQQWAFTKDWEPCDWFGREAWLRVICDAVTLQPPLARVIDHKTGRFRAGYHDQVELFALATMARYADIDEVQTELWYLDHGEVIENKFDRSMEKKLKAKWEKRSRPMLIDRSFPPKPGAHCRWCNYSVNKLGGCKY